MRDNQKTKAELLQEVKTLRNRVAKVTKKDNALRLSDQKWYSLLKNTPDIVMIVDPEGTIRFINHTVPGITIQETIGKKVYDYISPGHHDMMKKHIERVFQTGRSISHEISGVGRNGGLSWYQAEIGPIKQNGHIVAASIITRDISEHRRIEEALKKSEERYRILVENQTDMVVKFDMDGVLLFVSPSYCKTFGKSQDELTGSKFMPLIHEEDREKVAETLKKVYKPPYTAYVEERALTKDGWRWQAWLNTSILNNKKKVEAVVGVGRDITEQKRLEQTLRESEEKYRTVVESAGESIAMYDNKGSLLFINERGAKQLGGKPKDFIGKTMWDLFPKKIADRQAGAVRKVISTEKELKDITLTELQGRPRWYNTTIVPLRNSSGKVTSALVMARDIHEQKQAEEALNEYREKITHAEQLITLGTLSAIMAHKLSSHLMAIRVSIENSLAELSTMSPPNTIIEDLNNSLSSLYNVVSEVDKIRDLANKPSEEIISEVNLKAVAERIVNLLKENAQRARVVLRLKDMHKLPTIYSNEQDIEQLFIALVENALQAADRKRNHRLVISGDVKDKQIELRFADTCGGIAKKNLDKIFEPFFTTRPPGEGTGLGLYIAEDIVSKAGGKVRVESKAGKGSTFFITLPINK